MRKLTLNVEQLEVQSFLTTNQPSPSAGTVDGYDSGRPPGMTRQQSCPGYEATCPATCDDYTCDNYTCVGYTCDEYTCDKTCQTNVCACQLTDVC